MSLIHLSSLEPGTHLNFHTPENIPQGNSDGDSFIWHCLTSRLAQLWDMWLARPSMGELSNSVEQKAHHSHCASWQTPEQIQLLAFATKGTSKSALSGHGEPSHGAV